jgi:hypothetical protein
MNPINGELATDLHADLENAPEEVARTELGGNPLRWLVGHDAHSRPRCGKSRPEGPMLTKRASGRSRTNVAKAALISRLLLAWRTGMLGKPHAILNPVHLGERHVD